MLPASSQQKISLIYTVTYRIICERQLQYLIFYEECARNLTIFFLSHCVARHKVEVQYFFALKALAYLARTTIACSPFKSHLSSSSQLQCTFICSSAWYTVSIPITPAVFRSPFSLSNQTNSAQEYPRVFLGPSSVHLSLYLTCHTTTTSTRGTRGYLCPPCMRPKEG